MNANERRAPERERDGEAMPDRLDEARADGGPVPRVPETRTDRDHELANPRALRVPARRKPGFIVLYRADDGRVQAGHVPETCPDEAMEHALRAFHKGPSTHPVEGPSPEPSSRVETAAGGRHGHGPGNS